MGIKNLHSALKKHVLESQIVSKAKNYFKSHFIQKPNNFYCIYDPIFKDSNPDPLKSRVNESVKLNDKKINYRRRSKYSLHSNWSKAFAAGFSLSTLAILGGIYFSPKEKAELYGPWPSLNKHYKEGSAFTLAPYFKEKGLESKMGSEMNIAFGSPSTRQVRVLAGLNVPGSYGGNPYGRLHEGDDLDMIYEPVIAGADGVVDSVIWRQGYGLCVEVIYPQFGVDENGRAIFMTRDAHLSSVRVVRGQKVHEGDTLAISGSTGSRCNGPHNHHELRLYGDPINPEEYTEYNKIKQDTPNLKHFLIRKNSVEIVEN